MCMQLPRFVLPSILLVVSFSLEVRSAEPAPDSIAIVRRFADAMLDKSRANLPHKDLPLFPLALTRDTFQVPRIKVGNLVTARVPQEFKTIANIHHDLNLYQIFYALTKITGDAKYAAEADRVIEYFLKHCQEPKYGFFCWGEHLGWDVLKNEPGGFFVDKPGDSMIHEFYRPWIFWDKSWDMAPEACHRFSQALWRHQIDHTGGKVSFSRHAMIASLSTDFPVKTLCHTLGVSRSGYLAARRRGAGPRQKANQELAGRIS